MTAPFRKFTSREPLTEEEETRIAHVVPESKSPDTPLNTSLAGLPRLKIVNLIARFEIDLELGHEGLLHIATHLRNVEYNPKYGRNSGFPAAIFRVRVPKVHTFLIFGSGSIVINGGCKSEADARGAAKFCMKALRKVLPSFTDHKIKMQNLGVANIVAHTELDYGCHFEKVHEHMSNAHLHWLMKRPSEMAEKEVDPEGSNYFLCTYEPERFAGIHIRARCWKDDPLEDHHHRPTAQKRHTKRKGLCCTVFANGKLKIVGAKREIQLLRFFDALLPILLRYPIDKSKLPSERLKKAKKERAEEKAKKAQKKREAAEKKREEKAKKKRNLSFGDDSDEEEEEDDPPLKRLTKPGLGDHPPPQFSPPVYTKPALGDHPAFGDHPPPQFSPPVYTRPVFFN